MQNLINYVRSTLTEATADDYAHDATNTANSHSQHATRKEYHMQASKMHKIAHDIHAEREAINGGKYHGLLMQHHKNMMAFHDDQSNTVRKLKESPSASDVANKHSAEANDASTTGDHANAARLHRIASYSHYAAADEARSHTMVAYHTQMSKHHASLQSHHEAQ